MEKFFRLKESNTNVSTELLAGLTTFFTMAYILFVNPQILSATGIPVQAVFLATIFASVAGTLVMGLFANVPYALAPGMGLNAFFVTVCLTLGYTWQETLAMVFICGLINVFITVTKIRKQIIKSIPVSLQNAIGGGIGIFIAYLGFMNAGFITVNGFPGTNFGSPTALLCLAGLVITLVLLLAKVKGAILIGIVVTTALGIPFGIVSLDGLSINASAFSDSFADLGSVFGVALGSEGLGSLFSDASRLPQVLSTIFAFSLADTFDTLGTFIGTGRKTGIFSQEDEIALESGSGFSSKMDKALFADSIATSVGAVLGTSNTTTYVESAAGIGAGGKTGLTAVVVAVCFIFSIVLSPVIGIIPPAATSPALIVVGIMMMSSFADIEWGNLEVAIPAFFAGTTMALAANISTGIGLGFIAYALVKIVTGKAKEIHPILAVSVVLFIINFYMTIG